MEKNNKLYRRVNELHPELLGVHALNYATAYNSPARGVMFAGHWAQRLIIKGSEPKIIVTGAEEEFGKYTFSVKMPEDGVILRVIERYSTNSPTDAIAFNPETLVIYRAHETGVIDCFTIPYHSNHHPNFGFEYETKPAYDELVVGRTFEKDTPFADSPAVKGESHYTYGKNLNVVYMSHPNVGLDGYLISRDVLDAFEFRFYETRTVEFGANEFPLNLYGNEEVYKPFPDIGDYIREDGLVAALRRFDASLSPALLSRKDLMQVDHYFDTRTYSRPGVGRVIDMMVVHSENVNRQLPPQMTDQVSKYARALTRFHREIVNFDIHTTIEHRKHHGGASPKYSEKLHRLIVESRAMVENESGRARQNLTLNYRKEPLDSWRVTITIEYRITPTTGFKLTCENGGKGVISRIEEPENMPVDADGNRADIVSAPDSVPGRMNLGRLYTPYFTGAARDIRKQILEEMGLPRQFKGTLSIEEIQAIPPAQYAKGVETLLRLYAIVSPRTHHEFTAVLTDYERLLWVQKVINDKIYLYIPIESEKMLDEMVSEIEKNFKLVYGPVSYVGRSGERVTTKNSFRIAPLYMMLLDKIADAWLSVDIGKHNNFGILAAMNKADKHSTPWRKTPPRLFGETESQLYCCYGGREMIAELHDRSGSIASQKEISKTIMTAANPMQIDEVIDREKVPLGSARPIQIVQHLFNCAGFSIVYGEED